MSLSLMTNIKGNINLLEVILKLHRSASQYHTLFGLSLDWIHNYYLAFFRAIHVYYALYAFTIYTVTIYDGYFQCKGLRRRSANSAYVCQLSFHLMILIKFYVRKLKWKVVFIKWLSLFSCETWSVHFSWYQKTKRYTCVCIWNFKLEFP